MKIMMLINRGLVCRNILRCGVLEELLRDPENEVVILFPLGKEPLPDYLREEFLHPRVTIDVVPQHKDSFFVSRIWQQVINNLVYENMTDMLAREGSGKVKPVPRWWYPIHKRLFTCLSHLDFMKRAIRWLDLRVVGTNTYREVFKKYKPDVVYVGSIISKFDLNFMKAAQRMGIKTVGMQKGWDNLQKQLIRVLPDVFPMQNSLMIEAATKIQGIPAERLKVVGFPQFDNYAKREGLMTREEFCSRLGVDSGTSMFLFGSEGLWTPKDDVIIDCLTEMANAGKFVGPVHFIVRPHFSDISKGRYGRFKGIPSLTVDDGYRWGKFFLDSWDPSKDDMRWFESILSHMTGLIGYASTLSLDAACFDKPIINVTYGSFPREDGTDGTANLYRMDHYQPVMESGAVELVGDDEALVRAINGAIQNPKKNAAQRTVLREKMCGILDGKSSVRIAQVLMQK